MICQNGIIESLSMLNTWVGIITLIKAALLLFITEEEEPAVIIDESWGNFWIICLKHSAVQKICRFFELLVYFSIKSGSSAIWSSRELVIKSASGRCESEEDDTFIPRLRDLCSILWITPRPISTSTWIVFWLDSSFKKIEQDLFVMLFCFCTSNAHSETFSSPNLEILGNTPLNHGSLHNILLINLLYIDKIKS